MMDATLESSGVYVVQAVFYSEQTVIGVASSLSKAITLVDEYRSVRGRTPESELERLEWEPKPNLRWIALTWRRSSDSREVLAYDIQFVALNALFGNGGA